MQTAVFRNISSKPFTGYWDGRAKTFKPGEEMMMPLWLAEHYAKHLTNAILISRGNMAATSPKKPNEVPLFMELFNQCCVPDIEEPEKPKTSLEADIEAMNVNRKEKVNPTDDIGPAPKKGEAPQIIKSKIEDVDDDDEDESEKLSDDSEDETAEFPDLKK